LVFFTVFFTEVEAVVAVVVASSAKTTQPRARDRPSMRVVSFIV
jgi:hypothetical protein